MSTVEEPALAATVRPFTAADTGQAVDLLRTVMGWEDDERPAAFFRWKHHDNHFGASPGWVAEDAEGRLAALRMMMRWRFRTPDGVVDAVRAVDTATHPDHRGQGWFRRLTLRAVDELSAAGVGFVFNTPNSQSWPGYRSMGWDEVASPALALRPSRLGRLTRLPAARAAADKWAEPAGTAPRAAELLGDDAAVAGLIPVPGPDAAVTDRSAGYLRWRYGFEPLGYQALAVDDDPARGLVVYRVRRRGGAKELTLCELLVPGPARVARRLVARALADSGADYVLGRRQWWRRAGLVAVPGIGPRLTTRTLSTSAPRLSLDLGDVELF